jgi:hypothetical protein
VGNNCPSSSIQKRASGGARFTLTPGEWVKSRR